MQYAFVESHSRAQGWSTRQGKYHANSGTSISIGRSSDENTLSDLTPAEREHYLAWWRKFKTLDMLNWLGIGIALGSYLGHRYYASGSWETIAIAGFALGLVTRIWMRALICPRCEATFSGGLITVINRFSFLDKCYGCDLSQRELAALERRGY